MLTKHIIDLQLFAEGGNGGSAGEGAAVTSGVSDVDGAHIDAQVPSSIPERAKKHYLKALEKTKSAPLPQQESKNHPQDQSADDPTATNEEREKKPSYSELIKSEDYKAEHEAYMQKTIGDRLKKYSGIEKENAAAKDLLSQMASKFGIDPNSKTFFEDLKTAASKDDSEKRVRDYMEQHDVDEDEAKRVVEMEMTLRENKKREEAQKLAEAELQRKQEQEKMIRALRTSAEKTKVQYPAFDLDKEIQNEGFRRICAVTGGDTTAAYIATHHAEILQSTARAAARQANLQVSNAVAANRQRPSENGLQSIAPSVAETDFSRMGLKDLRAFAAEQRKLSRK